MPHLDHIIFNVSNPKVSLPFYKDFFTYLGYKIIEESEEHLAARKAGLPAQAGTADFWIIATEPKYLEHKYHRKGTGLNHFAFWLESKETVDQFYNDFLKPRGIATLYSTPKLFPNYTPDYYAVFFEDPDRIKLEVMYRAK